MHDVHLCECGCGEPAENSLFLPGHDQKLRSAMEAAVGGLLALKKIAEHHVGHSISTRRAAEQQTDPERIYQFILQQNGAAVCDDCIADELGFTEIQRVQYTTTPLGLTSDFHRGYGICSHCGDEKGETIQALKE